MTRNERSRFIAGVDWTLRVVGLLSFLMAGFAYNVSQRNTEETRVYAECQGRINAAVIQRAKNLDADVTRERNASRGVDDALAAIVSSALKGQNDPARGRVLVTALSAALSEQKTAREAADEARAKNPPVEPDSTC